MVTFVALAMVALGLIGLLAFLLLAGGVLHPTTPPSTSGGVVIVPATATPSPTATMVATVTPAPTAIAAVATVAAINAGGPTVGAFGADMDENGGSTSATTTTIDTSGTTNLAPPEVYQTERYGDFTYTIPNLIPGAAYTVRLHFAEIYWTQAGQRQFNVAINGQQVLTNFDIIAAAGGPNKAIVKSFVSNADNQGQLTIAFTTGSANFAKVSGIEILTNP